MPSELFSTEVRAMRDRSAMDDETFQTLLERVRDLHGRTDQLTRSKSRIGGSTALQAATIGANEAKFVTRRYQERVRRQALSLRYRARAPQ
jgi:hypothetical protein